MYQLVLPHQLDLSALPSGVRNYMGEFGSLVRFIEHGPGSGCCELDEQGRVYAYVFTKYSDPMWLLATLYHELGHTLSYPPFNRMWESWDEDEDFARAFEFVMLERTGVVWRGDEQLTGIYEEWREVISEQRLFAEFFAQRLSAYAGPSFREVNPAALPGWTPHPPTTSTCPIKLDELARLLQMHREDDELPCSWELYWALRHPTGLWERKGSIPHRYRYGYYSDDITAEVIQAFLPRMRPASQGVHAVGYRVLSVLDHARYLLPEVVVDHTGVVWSKRDEEDDLDEDDQTDAGADDQTALG